MPGGDIEPEPARFEHENDVSLARKKRDPVELIRAIVTLVALSVSFSINPVIGAALTAGVGITLTLMPSVRRKRGCLFLLGLALTLLTVTVVALGGAVYIALIIICKPYVQT